MFARQNGDAPSRRRTEWFRNYRVSSGKRESDRTARRRAFDSPRPLQRSRELSSPRSALLPDSANRVAVTFTRGRIAPGVSYSRLIATRCSWSTNQPVNRLPYRTGMASRRSRSSFHSRARRPRTREYRQPVFLATPVRSPRALLIMPRSGHCRLEIVSIVVGCVTQRPVRSSWRTVSSIGRTASFAIDPHGFLRGHLRLRLRNSKTACPCRLPRVASHCLAVSRFERIFPTRDIARVRRTRAVSRLLAFPPLPTEQQTAATETTERM